MKESNGFSEKFSSWVRSSVTLKLISILILILLFLIPIGMIKDLIREREYRQEAAINEVSSTWAHSQDVIGPVITVPVQKFYKVKDEKTGTYQLKKYLEYQHFLPEELNIEGQVHPEIRKRGIYEIPLYTSNLHISGHFRIPDISNELEASTSLLWDKASLSLGISDLRGIQEQLKLHFHDTMLVFNPGLRTDHLYPNGVSASLQLSAAQVDKVLEFSLDLKLNGSSNLSFVPTGKTTSVTLSGDWPHPSFNGSFLPDSHNITNEAFNAHWKVLHLNRPFPQYFRGENNLKGVSDFGVDLFVPVDEYQKNMRSVKYAIMIIVLTFLIFFFSQVIHPIRIHPMQYILVGFGLVLFYTLLLSLSEHMSFGLSYLLAAPAIILLITAYSHSIFKRRQLTQLMFGALILLYGLMYVLLQAKDYALLIGSVGLFVVLALIMYMSRNIDWYQLHTRKQEKLE